jgi:hypothetical protein
MPFLYIQILLKICCHQKIEGNKFLLVAKFDQQKMKNKIIRNNDNVDSKRVTRTLMELVAYFSQHKEHRLWILGNQQSLILFL